MSKLDSITILVPSLNEEKELRNSLDMMHDVCSRNELAYKIIIINDGSKDGTGRIADSLAGESDRIKVVHHDKPKGLSFCFQEGVSLAEGDFVIMLTGNNECDPQSIDKILKLRGEYDIIIPYQQNLARRPLKRRLASKLFTGLVNFVMGMSLKYFNGTVLHRTKLIKGITIQTDSYAFQAEALIKLISSGKSYAEVPIVVNYNDHTTKAFKIKNIIGVIKFFLGLVRDQGFQAKN